MNVLALFCGALVCRYALLGRRARVHGVDNDPWTLRTASFNYPADLLRLAQRDLLKADPGEVARYLGLRSGAIDLLLSTPCCQPWSAGRGKNKWDMDRRRTLLAMLPYIQLLQPRYVVLENVPGLADRRPGPLWLDEAKRQLRAMGYDWDIWRLLAADFGLPQLRRRLVIVAWRTGEKPPDKPLPTHFELPAAGQPKWRSLQDAIGHLTDEQARSKGWMRMSDDWNEKISRIKPGEPLYPGGRKRLAWPDPCSTLVTTPAVKKMPLLVHPDQDRYLTVLEYDLIQGSYPTRFPVGMSPARKFEAIGNGLPAEILSPVLDSIEMAMAAGSPAIVATALETAAPTPSPPAISQSPVIAVEDSKNPKTGPVAATYASQATCPSSCPFYRKGCYAEGGPCRAHTLRINASPITDPVAVARIEAASIDGISNPRGLRAHVVGDCTVPEAAKLVGEAMVRYQERTGGRAWTYTHAWREVFVEAWAGANVLASCETPSQVREARERGYATCMTVSEFASRKAYQQEGIRVVPCPEQTIGRKCISCRLCFDVARLQNAGVTIAFAAHGSKANEVRKTLQNGLIHLAADGFAESCA